MNDRAWDTLEIHIRPYMYKYSEIYGYKVDTTPYEYSRENEVRQSNFEKQNIQFKCI